LTWLTLWALSTWLLLITINTINNNNNNSAHRVISSIPLFWISSSERTEKLCVFGNQLISQLFWKADNLSRILIIIDALYFNHKPAEKLLVSILWFIWSWIGENKDKVMLIKKRRYKFNDVLRRATYFKASYSMMMATLSSSSLWSSSSLSLRIHDINYWSGLYI